MKYFIITIIAAVIIAFFSSDSIAEGISIVGIFIALYIALAIVMTIMSHYFSENQHLTETHINIPMLPFYSIKIAYKDILEVSKEPLLHASFSTTYLTFQPWGTILIKTKRGRNFVISAKNPDTFISEIKKHLANFPE